MSRKSMARLARDGHDTKHTRVRSMGKATSLPRHLQKLIAKARIEDAVRLALEGFKSAEVNEETCRAAEEAIRARLAPILIDPTLMPSIRVRLNAAGDGVVVDVSHTDLTRAATAIDRAMHGETRGDA